MSNKPETAAILRRTFDQLEMARGGLRQLLAPEPIYGRLMGFKNLVVWGRAVTNALQRLRSAEPGFDEWYEPYRKEMEADPLMKKLYTMRSSILKEAELEIETAMFLNYWGPNAKKYFGTAPVFAVDLVASEALGGAAWVIQTPGGEKEYFFVPLPPEIGTATAILPDSPRTHLGQTLKDGTIENIGKLYFGYLERLAHAGRRRFLDREGPDA